MTQLTLLLLLAALAIANPAGANTVQDFDATGSVYVLGDYDSGPGATVLPGGPTGNYMRLVSAVINSFNSMSFDRTDKGAFCDVTIDFDFRITPLIGSAEGFGVAMLDTAALDESGAIQISHEPNLSRSVGVGFDVHTDSGELNDNHVSIHYDGVLLTEVDATPVLDLDGTAGDFAHAQIAISSDDSGGTVSVTLTPPGGSPTALISGFAIPALRPYEGRAHFGARTSSFHWADHDLDNINVTYGGCPSVLGSWGPVLAWPVIAIHAEMLPTGNVLFWDRDDTLPGPPYLWDPITEAVTAAADPGLDLFCSGHSFLTDGRLFVAGGQDTSDGFGLPYGHIYDAYAGTWTQVSGQMNLGRWYPTNTPLGNGDVLVVSGSYELGMVNPLPEVYEPASQSWRDLTSAVLSMALYPLMHLAPDGTVVNVGPDTTTRRLDTSGTGSWTTMGDTGSVFRSTGTSVAYDSGEILLVGGGDPPTASAEVINLNDVTPQWRFVDPMVYIRRQLNSTILADGTVLMTGGTDEVGFDDATGAVFAPELWDPISETWKTLAGAQVQRIYHSHALLLPDGRVLTGGGGHPPGSGGGFDHLDAEVYSPPYLFNGPRPVIQTVQPRIPYGSTFSISTPDASEITAVHLLRLGAVTHGFNQNQLIARLSFSIGTNELLATAPATGNLAPPGHYMLFILNDDGVPSVSKLVQLGVPEDVPALPLWGLGGLAGLLATGGSLIARRRATRRP